jgi:predicted dehydrogenase
VATPTAQHHQVAVDLLRGGVHLLVEKPIALTVAEADEMVALAQQQRLVLRVGHVERFNPALASVRPHLSQPHYIEAVRSSTYTFRSTDIGVVLDLMIHDIDLVLSLVQSRVTDVRATGVTIFGPHEDMAQARLEFANGCVANLSASRTSFVAQRKLQVYSEQAYAGIDLTTRTAKIVRPCEQIRERSLNVHSLSAAEQAQVRERLFTDYLPLEEVQVGERNAILDEQQDFIHSIRHLHEPQVTGEQGRDALAVAEAILASIATRHEHAPRPAAAETSSHAPAATASSHVLTGPHWHAMPKSTPQSRRAS